MKNYDAIVIGAGMAGLGTAIGLARKGQKVLVVSKKMKGASSPAAGGILDPFLEMKPGHPLFQLSREAFRQYPGWVKRLESKTRKKVGYKKTGMLFIAMSHEDMRELEKRYAWQKTTGISVQWRTRVNVLKKDPEVNPKLLGGLFYPTVARVQPKKLIIALTNYAKLLGVQFLWVSKSPKLHINKGSVESVKIDGHTLKAPAIVNATGSWAGLGETGKKLPVQPAKGQILIVRIQKSISTILHSLDGGYVVPWNDSPLKGNMKEYLLGSTVEKVGFQPNPTPQGLKKVLQKNARIMPSITEARRVDAWAGLRPFSEKKLPMIGPSQIKGLYLAVGYYRSGILIGFYAGELLAKAIVSGKMPLQLRAFDPRKFSL